MRRALLAAIVAMVALGAAMACSSSSDTPAFPEVVTLGKGEIFPSIVNSTLSAGQNRVSMKLTDRDDNKVLDANVHVRYYNLNRGKTKFRSEADARFIPVQLSYVDEQSGTNQTVNTGDDGVYVSYANFDEGGDWGVEIQIERGGKRLDPIPFRFNVLDQSVEPAVGDAAPPSLQMVLANVASDEEIDSSSPPRPAMHTMTIADAVKSGRPSVIAFTTPAFCQTRTCAPVMDDVMDPLAASFAGRVNFIHVEPYVLLDLRQANVQNPVPATREWRLGTEPWVFVVDQHGRVAAKFEGILARDEVESVLDVLLDTSQSSVTPAGSAAP
jgi:hypothetical protein